MSCTASRMICGRKKNTELTEQRFSSSLEWKKEGRFELNFFFFVLLLLFNLSLISAGMLCCSNTALDLHWVCGKQGLSARFSLTLHTNTLISLHSPKFQLKFSHTNTLNPACASLWMAEAFPTLFQWRGCVKGRLSLAAVCHTLLIWYKSGGPQGCCSCWSFAQLWRCSRFCTFRKEGTQPHLWPCLSSSPFESAAKGFIHKSWDVGFLCGCKSGVHGGVQSFGLYLMNQLSLRTSPGDSKCGGCEGTACLSCHQTPTVHCIQLETAWNDSYSGWRVLGARWLSSYSSVNLAATQVETNSAFFSLERKQKVPWLKRLLMEQAVG